MLLQGFYLAEVVEVHAVISKHLMPQITSFSSPTPTLAHILPHTSHTIPLLPHTSQLQAPVYFPQMTQQEQLQLMQRLTLIQCLPSGRYEAKKGFEKKGDNRE